MNLTQIIMTAGCAECCIISRLTSKKWEHVAGGSVWSVWSAGRAIVHCFGRSTQWSLLLGLNSLILADFPNFQSKTLLLIRVLQSSRSISGLRGQKDRQGHEDKRIDKATRIRRAVNYKAPICFPWFVCARVVFSQLSFLSTSNTPSQRVGGFW